MRMSISLYKKEVLECLERSGHPGKFFSKEETEITNMCSALNRPVANCTGLLLRIRNNLKKES